MMLTEIRTGYITARQRKQLGGLEHATVVQHDKFKCYSPRLHMLTLSSPPPIFTLPVASVLLLVIQPVNNPSVEQRYKIISITLMHLHHHIIIIIIIIMQSTVLSFNAAVHATALHSDHLPTVLHLS